MHKVTAADNVWLTASVIIGYFLVLLLIGRLTSKKNDNATFFTANRSSAWYVVAFGMIGTSISGVTFISIPGQVGKIAFSYFQLVLGYFAGYLVIIKVLLPLYYRLNLTSIYTYLEQRFGWATYKTGASFFLLSRSMGSAVRLLLATRVFQVFIFEPWHIPFEFSVVISMLLILLYSIRGGIKTIIWTDNLQTAFLVGALILTILFLNRSMDFSALESFRHIASGSNSQVFFWDFLPKTYFWKQFLGGMFITITMTGLDQDLMQKNLTCRSLKESQKNMFVFSVVLVAVNLLFLCLGSLLYLYAGKHGVAIPQNSDELFPEIAFNYLPLLSSLVFLVGLTAATFASTDSALTALVTSFCIDILNFNKKESDHRVGTRYKVHAAFAMLIVLLVIVIHYASVKNNIIDTLFLIAAYTYGPLLGLFTFGLFTKRSLKDQWVPFVCLLSPVLAFAIQWLVQNTTFYVFGNEVILLNGVVSTLGLALISTSKRSLIQ